MFSAFSPNKKILPSENNSLVRPRRASIEKIAVIFNLKKNNHREEEEEYDEISTIEAVEKEIEKSGYKVILLEYGDNLCEALEKNKPDFVFNIAEGKGCFRGREAQVPCILESMNIPYSGADPVALGVTLEKYLTNTILRAYKIPVPLMYVFPIGDKLNSIPDIFSKRARFIVKPRWEGSSKGIFYDSLVNDSAQLKKKVKSITRHYKQPVVIEEFLKGDEITAGVCGNGKDIRILGMMKVVPRSPSGDFIYSLEVKREWEDRVRYESQNKIPLKERAKVSEYAIKVFRALELRDIARVDFRVDSKGTPCVIDVNPLPGLSPRYSDLPILCRLNGITYSCLIKIILSEALKRNGRVVKR